jgi:hypothetical protein
LYVSAGYQTPTSDVGVDDRHPALQKGCCIANAIRSYENLSFRALFRDVLLPDRIDPAHREQPSDVVEILDQVLHENTLAKQKKHRKANRVQEGRYNRFQYGCRPVLGAGQRSLASQQRLPQLKTPTQTMGWHSLVN